MLTKIQKKNNNKIARSWVGLLGGWKAPPFCVVQIFMTRRHKVLNFIAMRTVNEGGDCCFPLLSTFFFILSTFHFLLLLAVCICRLSRAILAHLLMLYAEKMANITGAGKNCFEDCQIYEDCPGIVIIASWFVWSGGCASVFGASNNNYCIIRKC